MVYTSSALALFSVSALSLGLQEKERRKRCKLVAKGQSPGGAGSKAPATELKMVCGKCGAKGHMRTNKVRVRVRVRRAVAHSRFEPSHKKGTKFGLYPNP